MQTFEFIIGLLTFLLIAQILSSSPNVSVDDSLYKYQLANDVWRVFYLKGHLTSFDKIGLNSDANKITSLTGLCIEFEEEDVTSCIVKNQLITINKLAYYNGKINSLTIKIGSGHY